MTDKLGFLDGYNPAGRLAFAMSPNAMYFRIFEDIVKVTGRNIPSMLISMYYLQGKNGIEKLDRTRSMCDRLLVDSGVFSFRSSVLKDQEIPHKVAYWKLTPATKNRIIDVCREREDEFDAFAHDYADFLSANESKIDLAIDLDVEQMLGLEKANLYYEWLCDAIGPSKVMRVWHAYKRTWKDWEDWCESGEHEWLAMEGPDQHGRSTDMYSRFVMKAHQHGIKVHVLATTTMRFLLQVPMDSCDSSTYTVGGRWARLLLPDGGDILIGENYKRDYGDHFDNLAEVEKEKILRTIRLFGFTMEELNKSHEARCHFNALVMLRFFDKPIPEVTTRQVLY